MNKTRPSQKTMNVSGMIPSRRSTRVLLSKAGNSCGRAKNKDAEAMNSAKHIRQKMPGNSLSPEETAAQEHVRVVHGRNQSHGNREPIAAGGKDSFSARRAVGCFYGVAQADDSDRQHN